MSIELLQTIEAIGREKGISPDVIISAVEDAIVTAAKKFYRTEEEFVSRLDRETGQLRVYIRKQIVESVTDKAREISLDQAKKIDPAAEIDGAIEQEKETNALGRISAHAAKQVIFQKVREAERENIFSEYEDRVGEIVTGVVKRFERGDMIVDLGKTEAILPRSEQCRHEVYNQGDRVRSIIINVHRIVRGPQVVLSRADTSFLRKLFEMEVPELYDGTVVIKEAVREAGERAKIAVVSRDKDVDPVGSCVGMKGARVQSVIRELRGEKIDIVQWSPDPETFVSNALSPATVSRIIFHGEDQENRWVEVIVDERQLSLAIGKKGQNVRLAAKLTGYRIDIKSEEEKREEVLAEMDRITTASRPISEIPGLGDKTAERLIEYGFEIADQIRETTVEQLCAVPGIGEKTAEKIRSTTLEFLGLNEDGTSIETPETEEVSTEEGGEGETASGDELSAEDAEADAEPSDSAASETGLDDSESETESEEENSEAKTGGASD